MRNVNYCIRILIIVVLLMNHFGDSFKSLRHPMSLFATRQQTPLDYTDPSDLLSTPATQQPLIPRRGDHENYAAKWQAKGNLYISYENLRSLNEKLQIFREGDKKTLLSDVMMTYFARFHNIIREEYQYEKKNVEERLVTWPLKRLRNEGFVLLDLYASPKGNLFQEKVFRFKLKDGNLPFHRFGTGDTVRVSISKALPSQLVSEGGADSGIIDGVVLDRRKGYLDICLKAVDAIMIERRQRYRLDAIVNRVTYDRMIESLQLFLQAGDGITPISRTLRDLILYTYPNSITRLASTPGGLRMALPSDDAALQLYRPNERGAEDIAPILRGGSTADSSVQRQSIESTIRGGSTADSSVQRQSIESTTLSPEQRGTSDDDVLRRISEILGEEHDDGETDLEDEGSSRREQENLLGRGTGKDSPVRRMRSSRSSTREQLEQPVAVVATEAQRLSSALTGRPLRNKAGDVIGYEPRALSSGASYASAQSAGESSASFDGAPKVVTVAEMLSKLRNDKNARPLDPLFADNLADTGNAATSDDLASVFSTNAKLRAMAEKLDSSSATGVTPYSLQEISMGLQAIGASNNVALNPSQLNALQQAIIRPLTLIQGPPGTGKTRTACHILSVLVNMKDQRLRSGGDPAKGQKSLKTLACAHSNVATDNLLDGLLKLGVRAVRLGRPANVRSSLWNSTLDSLLQKESAWIAARTRLDAAVEYYGEARQNGGAELGVAQRVLADAKRRFERTEARCVAIVLNEAEVVVSTCIGAGGDTLRNYCAEESIRFSSVLIDEAAQCMESASLPALLHGCERLILIGDHNQLPPVVTSPTALEHGLGVSLFARLTAGGMVPSLLDEQYRMHPKIAEFPSKRFYAGRVRSMVDPGSRPQPKGYPWPRADVPVVFLDISASKYRAIFEGTATNMSPPEDERSLNSSILSGPAVSVTGGFETISSGSQVSYKNDAEAEFVTGIIEDLLAGGSLALSDIGVISPYNAQVRALADRFRSKGWIDRSSEEISSETERWAGAGGERSEVGGGKIRDRTKRKDVTGSAGNSENGNNSKTGSAAGAIDVTKSISWRAELVRKLAAMGEIDEDDEPEESRVGSSSSSSSSQVARNGNTRLAKKVARAISPRNFNPNDSEDESRDEEDGDIPNDDVQLDRLDALLGGEEMPAVAGIDQKGIDGAVGATGAVAAVGAVAADNRQRLADKRKQEEYSDSSRSDQLEVLSVDGYQGREKDLIVFSAVRSNRQGKVGFLKDWRRLNVALTRARCGLIVVGDSSTLRSERNWRAFIEWCDAEGVRITASSESTQDILKRLYS